MLWGLNIQRKKLIENFRQLSPHVWYDNFEDFLLSNNNNAPEKNEISTHISNTITPESGKHSLKNIFDDYIFYALNTEKSIKSISVINYTNKFLLCYDVLQYCMNLDENDCINIEDIQIDHVRTLKYVIERFPKRIDIRFKDYSIRKICELIINKNKYPLTNKTKTYLDDKIGIKTIQN
jgi:hypothetical protein